MVRHGFLNKSEIDGKYGPNTRDAVKEFQKKKNIQADGGVGPETR